MIAQCDNCRFWVDLASGGEGHCHRHAPQPINFYGFGVELLTHLTMLSWQVADEEQQKRDFKRWQDAPGEAFVIWVKTDCDDWCGEHEPGEPR